MPASNHLKSPKVAVIGNAKDTVNELKAHPRDNKKKVTLPDKKRPDI